MGGQKEHADGWTVEEEFEELYHFEHVPRAEAEYLLDVCEKHVFIIVTINPVHADDGSWHRNHYFARGLTAAIAKVAMLTIYASVVAERVVEFRPATAEEGFAWETAVPVEE